jgi:hypothetical protein
MLLYVSYLKNYLLECVLGYVLRVLFSINYLCGYFVSTGNSRLSGVMVGRKVTDNAEPLLKSSQNMV